VESIFKTSPKAEIPESTKVTAEEGASLRFQKLEGTVEL